MQPRGTGSRAANRAERDTDPAGRRGERGLSTIEVALLIAVVALALVVTIPLFYRGAFGQFFFGSVQQLDRPFDPHDTNASKDFSQNKLNTFLITKSEKGLPGEPLYAPTSPMKTFGGLSMWLANLPQGLMPRPSAFATSVQSRSWGTSQETYTYHDQR